MSLSIMRSRREEGIAPAGHHRP